MVFFFIGFLSVIVLFVFPLSLSVNGYIDKNSHGLRLTLRLNGIEKLFGSDKKKKETGKEVKEVRKKKGIRLPKKISLSDLPLSIIEEIGVSVMLPPISDDLTIILSAARVFNYFSPLKLSVYQSKDFYLELSAGIRCNLLVIFPFILHTLISKGE